MPLKSKFMKPLNKLYFVIILSFVTHIGFLKAQTIENQNSRIVSVDWLSEHIKDPDLVVLHISPIKSEYTREHIEGSRFLWTGYLSNSTPEANSVPLPIPSMRKSLQKLGISNHSKIVLSFMSGNIILTCRMYMILDYLGLGDQTYILNGGVEAWKAAGHQLTNKIPAFKKGKFVPSVKNEVFVDTTWILKNQKNPDVVLIDARPAPFYDGKMGTPRAGHIPGALNIPSTKLYDESTFKFLSDDKLTELFNKPTISKSKEIVSYCFVGNAASSVYFIARHLGYKVSLYDGSMEEWANRFDLPMEKTE
jgi:thiosulfate/3-mercaptopyruvate sulfurtransferase